MAERSNAAVLKTVEGQLSGGSNPSLSAEIPIIDRDFSFMPFYTYILKSLKDNGYYYGHTSDIDSRLVKHNSKKVRSTKSRTPFVVHYLETFQTKSEAYKQELFFKSADGKKYLKEKGIM
jgi:putative endonuclease